MERLTEIEQQFTGGNNDALAILIEHSRPLVWAYMRKKYRIDEHSFEDLLQDAAVRLLSNRSERFRGDQPFHNYLLTIVIRLHMDKKRTEKRRLAKLKTYRPPQSSVNTEVPTRVVFPAKYEDVLSLYFRGLTQKNIAVALQIPHGTAKRWVHNGLKGIKYD